MHREQQGGGIKYVKSLINNLERLGVSVDLAGISSSGKDRSGVSFRVIRKDRGNLLWIIKVFLLIVSRRMRSYDIFHVHRPIHGLPFIICGLGSKTIITLHGETFSKSRRRFLVGELLFTIGVIVESFVLRKVKLVVPVSSRILKVYQSRSHNFSFSEPIGSTSEIECCEVPYYSKLKRLGAEDGFSFVGRLAVVKDLPFLIDVLQELISHSFKGKFFIAGDGEERSNLKKLVRKKNLSERVIFLGELSPPQVGSLLSITRCLVLSSQSEASPTVLKEAIALGTSIVTNDVGDAKVVTQAVNNAVVVDKDIKTYAESIEMVQSLKINIVEQDFSALSRAKSYLELYEK